MTRFCPFLDPDAVSETLRERLSARYPHLVAANLRTFERGYHELQAMTWPPAPGDHGRPVQRAAPAFGYLDAPIGGAILDPGNSIVKDMSTSRQGSLPAFDPASCVHCGICDIVCPDLCFVWSQDGHGEPAVRLLGIDYRYCKGCLRCVQACPTGSLTELAEEEGWAERHRVPLFGGNKPEGRAD